MHKTKTAKRNNWKEITQSEESQNKKCAFAQKKKLKKPNICQNIECFVIYCLLYRQLFLKNNRISSLYPAKKIETQRVSKASEYSVLFALLLARLRLAYCCAHRGLFAFNRGGRTYMPTPAWWGLKTPWKHWTFWGLNANTTTVFLA